MLARRTLPLLAAVLTLSSISGCAFFGTQDGLESDGGASLVGRNVQALASFDVVGISPAEAQPGEQATVYTVSEADAPTSEFTIDDFWFCTFDGESAMLETGGDEYEANVDLETVASIEDLDTSIDDLDGGTASSITFTVPEGSVTGDGLFFTPSGDTRDFYLAIGGY